MRVSHVREQKAEGWVLEMMEDDDGVPEKSKRQKEGRQEKKAEMEKQDRPEFDVKELQEG